MLGPAPDERETWHFEIMNFGGPLGIVRAGTTQGKGRLLAQMIGGTREAEGRLMAAAPDLLEAAKAMLDAIEVPCSKCAHWCDGECCDVSCAVHAALARIEAAVAKAEGRAEE